MTATVFWDRESDPNNPGYSVEYDGQVWPLDARDEAGAAREAAAMLRLALGDVVIEGDLDLPPAGGVTKPAMPTKWTRPAH